MHTQMLYGIIRPSFSQEKRIYWWFQPHTTTRLSKVRLSAPNLLMEPWFSKSKETQLQVQLGWGQSSIICLVNRIISGSDQSVIHFGLTTCFIPNQIAYSECMVYKNWIELWTWISTAQVVLETFQLIRLPHQSSSHQLLNRSTLKYQLLELLIA